MDRVGRGKDRQVNARFLAMTNHYVFEPQFCNPASGWVEPSRVAIGPRPLARGPGRKERSRHARPRLWLPPIAFLGRAFQILAPSMPGWNNAASSFGARSRMGCCPERPQVLGADAWAEEHASLMAGPAAFDGFVAKSKRVSPTCLICFDRNRYSVPCIGLTRPHWGHGPSHPSPIARSACTSTRNGWWSSPKARSSANMTASPCDRTISRPARSTTGITIWLSFNASLALCG